MQPQQHRSAAPDYIRANFLPTDRLAVVLIDKRRNLTTQRLSTAHKIASDDYQAWLRYRNANREEIYLSMNTLSAEARGRLKSDVAEIRHIYVDFDQNGRDALKALRSRDDIPEPNHVITSSPGRYQVVWRVEGFTKEEAETLMRGMTRATGADIAATDCTRVLRIPGFFNHKPAYGVPHYVTVENLNNQVHRPEHFPHFDVDALEISPGRGGMHNAKPGARHSPSEDDWAYAMRALSRGEAPEAVAAAIEARRADKPDPKYYSRHTVENAVREQERRISTISR
jgi:hypothetical protein